MSGLDCIMGSSDELQGQHKGEEETERREWAVKAVSWWSSWGHSELCPGRGCWGGKGLLISCKGSFDFFRQYASIYILAALEQTPVTFQMSLFNFSKLFFFFQNVQSDSFLWLCWFLQTAVFFFFDFTCLSSLFMCLILLHHYRSNKQEVH